jgi:hypothetical protein
MSTFIGKVGTTPICHMTSDTQTQTTLEGDPISTTLFHSQLPYVFAREQFELTSYSSWNSGHGRTFAFSQDLIDFKDNNPDLACLVILEDSNGKRGLFTPTITLRHQDRQGSKHGMSSLGNEYTCAFTSSDTQLEDMTRQPNIAFTLYNFDTADTRITVFKHAYVGTYSNTTSACYMRALSTMWSDECTDRYDYLRANFPSLANCLDDWGGGSAVDLRSLASGGVDIVKVRFVFLNITNTASTFDRQPDYSGTSSITIKDDEFSVGNIDLIKNAPIVSHGLKNTSDTVDAVIGTLAGGMPSNYTNGIVNTLGKLSDGGSPAANNTPVLEFPDPSTASTTMEYDFSTKVFKRDGKPVFSATTAAKGLQVIGTKEIEFDFASGSFSGGTDTFVSLTQTQSGTITGAGANTLYLASMVYAADGTNFNQALPSCVYGVGRNKLMLFHYARVVNNQNYWIAAPAWVCDIDSSGNIDVKVHRRGGDMTSAISFTFGAMKLRLIAMDS